jgi:hypothetical protein
MSKAKASAKPRKMNPRAARPTPEGDIPRDADGWPVQSAKERTVSLFSPEELRRAETHRKAEASARRKLTKQKREALEADDDRKIREFNERTGL